MSRFPMTLAGETFLRQELERLKKLDDLLAADTTAA